MKFKELTIMFAVALSVVRATRAEDITGTVTDAITNNPIAGATLTVIGTNISQTTNASGAYTITGLAYGTYTIRAEADGYVPQEKSISLGGNSTAQTVVAGLFPTKPTACYDPITKCIRVYSGEVVREAMEFFLHTVDGRLAFRFVMTPGVTNISAQELAAAKYLWNIMFSRDGSVLANGAMEISR